jgi:hypothetical protein
LAVFWRTKQIYPEPLGGRGRERTAMGVVARPLVVRASVGFAGLPVDMLMGEPQGLHIHAV